MTVRKKSINRGYYLNRSRTRVLEPISVKIKAVRRLSGKPYSGQRKALLKLKASEKLMARLRVNMKLAGLKIIAVRRETCEIVVWNGQPNPIDLKPGDVVPVMRR